MNKDFRDEIADIARREARPSAGGGTSHITAGHHGVAIHGSGNRVYYGSPPATGIKNLWVRVWAGLIALLMALTLAWVWRQAPLFDASKPVPVGRQIFENLPTVASHYTFEALLAWMLSVTVVAGILTLALRYAIQRRR